MIRVLIEDVKTCKLCYVKNKIIRGSEVIFSFLFRVVK